MSRKRIFASQGFSKMRKRDIVWPDMLTCIRKVILSYQHAFDCISICMRIHSIFVDTKRYKSRNYDRVWLLPSMNTQIINGFFFTTAPFYGMSIVAIFYIIYLCIILHLYTIINYFMIFYLYCIKLNWVCIIFHFSIYTLYI